ncbi:Ubiquitin carboxyl-terminal hydrolase 5 (Deubiquitinating enzyme 5) (Isopeptidase T) (Ubiquitin thioesterase 5) (Ubiquitin-specific-processing protease 5), partial [Durusdinium trenchii]
TAAEGLLLNLATWQSYSRQYVGKDHARTGNELYMLVSWSREEEPEEAQESKKPKKEETKLAIGVDGGFSPPDEIGGKGKLVKEYGFVIYPDLDTVLPYPSPGGVQVPRALAEVADAVIAMDDASNQIEVAAWDAAEEPRPVSRFAENLEQLDNGVRISPDPKTWKCAESGMTENLWLNLSTGYIGSGRRNWDGSGGTGAALKHFEETGSKYPLCVKLGTITPDGKAEVFSYDPSENCLVEDPQLNKHLRHFGIDILQMKKTEKTMIEMEIDLNKSLTFSAVLEGGEKLVPTYGPGHVGLFNLGNSCYCNSVLQVLFSLEPFQQRFFYGLDQAVKDGRDAAFTAAPPEPQSDLATQFVKFAASMSDPFGHGVERSGGEDDVVAISPKMLKDCLGKGHPDFAGREQQDAAEYFLHVLDRLQRMERTKPHRSLLAPEIMDPGRWFDFVVEEKLVCQQSNQVQYNEAKQSILSLTIPLDESQQPKQESKGEEEELPVVAFEDCLHASIGPNAVESVADYLSPATGKRGNASKTPSLATFPRFLAVQMKRYVVGENWMPKKIECRVPVPERINLAEVRGNGIQPGEVALPDVVPGGAPSGPDSTEPDPGMLAQLMGMGFGENGCKRALLAVQNAGVEPAMQWVLEHMGDPDFNDPPPAPAATSAGAGASAGSVDPEQVTMLASMGFSEDGARLALKECSGNLERAADWLFSHAADLESLLAQDRADAQSGASAAPASLRDINDDASGKGDYILRGFISHLGKTTTGGHYLCHVKDADGKWVVCNDRKVAFSKNPPLDFGFLYVFERL